MFVVNSRELERFPANLNLKDMNYIEMTQSVNDAEMTLRMADLATEKLIPMFVNRLRACTSYKSIEALKKLKKELRDFNAVTGEWK